MKWAWEFSEYLYGKFCASRPVLSLIIAGVLGATIFVIAVWLVGQAYYHDHSAKKEEPTLQTRPAEQAVAPSPVKTEQEQRGTTGIKASGRSSVTLEDNYFEGLDTAVDATDDAKIQGRGNQIVSGKSDRFVPSEGKTPYDGLTTTELRNETARFVVRLRQFNNDFQVDDRRLTDEDLKKCWDLPDNSPEKQVAWKAMGDHTIERRRSLAQRFKSNFLTDAGLLEQELRRRIGEAVIAQKRPIALRGSLAGVDALGELATYLETLGKQLPDEKRFTQP